MAESALTAFRSLRKARRSGVNLGAATGIVPVVLAFLALTNAPVEAADVRLWNTCSGSAHVFIRTMTDNGPTRTLAPIAVDSYSSRTVSIDEWTDIDEDAVFVFAYVNTVDTNNNNQAETFLIRDIFSKTGVTINHDNRVYHMIDARNIAHLDREIHVNIRCGSNFSMSATKIRYIATNVAHGSRGEVPILEGPDGSRFRRIGSIPNHAKGVFVDRCDQWSNKEEYCQVSYNGMVGWAYKKYLGNVVPFNQK